MILPFTVVMFMMCFAVVLFLMATAPEGYEDEQGFHYGKPTDNIKDYNEKDSTSSGTGTV